MAPPATLGVPQVYYLQHYDSPIPFSPGNQAGRGGRYAEEEGDDDDEDYVMSSLRKVRRGAAKPNLQHASSRERAQPDAHKRSHSESFCFPLPPTDIGSTAATPYGAPVPPNYPKPPVDHAYPLGTGLQARHTLRRPLSMAHLKSVAEVAALDERLHPRTIEQWRVEAERYAHAQGNDQAGARPDGDFDALSTVESCSTSEPSSSSTGTFADTAAGTDTDANTDRLAPSPSGVALPKKSMKRTPVASGFLGVPLARTAPGSCSSHSTSTVLSSDKSNESDSRRGSDETSLFIRDVGDRRRSTATSITTLPTDTECRGDANFKLDNKVSPVRTANVATTTRAKVGAQQEIDGRNPSWTLVKQYHHAASGIPTSYSLPSIVTDSVAPLAYSKVAAVHTAIPPLDSIGTDQYPQAVQHHRRHKQEDLLARPHRRTVSIEQLYDEDAWEDDDGEGNANLYKDNQLPEADYTEGEEVGLGAQDGADQAKVLRLRRSLELLNLRGDFSEHATPSASLKQHGRAARQRQQQPKKRLISLGGAGAVEVDDFGAPIEMAAPSLAEQLANASDIEWSVDESVAPCVLSYQLDTLQDADMTDERHQSRQGPTAHVVVVLRSPALRDGTQHDASVAEVGSSWSRAASRVNSFNHHHAAVGGVRRRVSSGGRQAVRGVLPRKVSIGRKPPSGVAGVNRSTSIISSITEDSPILSGALSASAALQPLLSNNSGGTARALLMSPLDVERLFGVPLSAMSPPVGSNRSPIVVADVADAHATALQLLDEPSGRQPQQRHQLAAAKLELPSIAQSSKDGLAEFSYLLENDFFDQMRPRSPELHRSGASKAQVSPTEVLSTGTTSALPGIPPPFVTDQTRIPSDYQVAPKASDIRSMMSKPQLHDAGQLKNIPSGSTATVHYPVPTPSPASVLDRSRPKTKRRELEQPLSAETSPVFVVKTRYRTPVSRTNSNISDATVRPLVPQRKVSKDQLSQQAREASIPIDVAEAEDSLPAGPMWVGKHVNPHPAAPRQRPAMPPTTRVSFADSARSKPMHRNQLSQSFTGTSTPRPHSLASTSNAAGAAFATPMSMTAPSFVSSRGRRPSHTQILRGRALDDVRQSCHAKAAYIRATMDAKGGTSLAVTPAMSINTSSSGSSQGTRTSPVKSSRLGAFASRPKAVEKPYIAKSLSMPTALLAGLRRDSGAPKAQQIAAATTEAKAAIAPLNRLRRSSDLKPKPKPPPEPRPRVSTGKGFDEHGARIPARLQPSVRMAAKWTSIEPATAAPAFPVPPAGILVSPPDSS
ncbi:hypothetical protein K437DRAFT_32336 [Tilletiaria anomala UBC 951]|uniref:Uncharacterized protein n=1 Tax=Tilletiaria anomala (strain ATCC 24038 / CBS 436.72 / UBC 951) TaxID=1037660 RepID=A0A066WM97_TILAU|nr:uncharacterized protein K437DRAFT_32336 [Tilletiaria anomala UBC 951]KDN52124.1 hypothetical protein K437DRAFT_32336 [Tilletiaria anomala UBC 951]